MIFKVKAFYIQQLSKPLDSGVDHLAMLHQLYDERNERAPLSNLMRYFMNGLDEIPTQQEAHLWNRQAYQSQRKYFVDRYYELLEILQADYDSFKYNFEIIEQGELNASQFSKYPIWAEFYDYDELDQMISWGVDQKKRLEKELKRKEIDGQHPYYTVPISAFPIERMRYFTKATFKALNGTKLSGMIMNEGTFGIGIFLGEEQAILTKQTLFQEENQMSLQKISDYYEISISQLSKLTFETEVPARKDRRIHGTFEIQ